MQRTKGGMASVISGFISSDAEKHGYKLEHFISHVEGGPGEKLIVFLKCFFRLLVTRDAALAHIHTACDASFYRKAILAFVCRLKGVPVIMHIHGADFDSFYLKGSRFTKAFIKSSLKHCDRVIVLSAYWKRFFQDNLALNNIVVLFNAVNYEAFSACCTIPQHINSFLFLGRLGERKGIYDLVKAVDILIKQESRRELKFYFAGDGEVEEVRKLVKQLDLQDQIELLGWVGDKQKMEVLLKADTVVLPSYNEGLPVALLEAMAAGKVILSTPVGGIPDLVSEGINGFLISPGDISGLAASIKHICQHPDEMRVISKNNSRKIEAEYSNIKINEQLFALYDTILADRGKLSPVSSS